MGRFSRVATALVLAPPATARFLRSSGGATHPVEDIISTLQGLSSQVEKDGKTEALAFEKFTHWCGRSKKSLNEGIAKSESTLEEVAEVIEAKTQEIDVLTKEIAALGEELGKLSTAGTAADQQRTADAQLATAEMSALTSTIQAVKDALNAMTTAESTTEPGLLQQKVNNVLALASVHMTASQSSMLQTFSDNNPVPPTRAPITRKSTTPRPTLNATDDYEDHIDTYDFKSEKVIELLKNLQTKFEADLTQRTKEETASLNAYELAKEAREDLTNAATASQTEKTGLKGTAQTDLGTAQGVQTDARADLAADQGLLKSTSQDCSTRATEWAERTEVREKEREAIAAAVEILGKVTGVRTSPPSNPVPPASPVLLQLSSTPGNKEVQTALKLLREAAKVSHSAAVEQLAQAVAVHANDTPKGSIHEGPFVQVINSIEKMIFRLQNEQTEEDNHKNWCDKELEKTDLNIADKVDKIAELEGKINVDNGRIGTLTSDIAAANTKVNDVVAFMKEATEMRKENKEQNSLAVKDAEAAQTAITQAIAVIKDFYQGSGGMAKEAWEFVQAPVTLNSKPSTWSAPYTGVADPSNAQDGIISLMTTVASDFATMEANTIAQEESDQQSYEDDMKDAKIEQARRTKEAEVKGQEKERLSARVASMEATKKSVQKEKDAGDQYKSDLQPACVDGGSTYQDRKDARAAEVTALKAAQTHLQDAFKDI